MKGCSVRGIREIRGSIPLLAALPPCLPLSPIRLVSVYCSYDFAFDDFALQRPFKQEHSQWTKKLRSLRALLFKPLLHSAFFILPSPSVSIRVHPRPSVVQFVWCQFSGLQLSGKGAY